VSFHVLAAGAFQGNHHKSIQCSVDQPVPPLPAMCGAPSADHAWNDWVRVSSYSITIISNKLTRIIQMHVCDREYTISIPTMLSAHAENKRASFPSVVKGSVQARNFRALFKQSFSGRAWVAVTSGVPPTVKIIWYITHAIPCTYIIDYRCIHRAVAKRCQQACASEELSRAFKGSRSRAANRPTACLVAE
jgi:hypothetical protein